MPDAPATDRRSRLRRLPEQDAQPAETPALEGGLKKVAHTPPTPQSALSVAKVHVFDVSFLQRCG